MKRFLAIFLAVGLAFQTAGCEKKNEEENTTEQTSETATETTENSEEETKELEYDEYGYAVRNVTEKNATGYIVADDDTPIMYTSVTYPVIDNPEDLLGINELNYMYSLMDEQAASAYTNTEIAKEANDDYLKMGKDFVPYTAECVINVEYNKGNLISVKVEREEFKGNDSQGNYRRSGDTRTLDKNEYVTIEDIFNADESEINEIIESGFEEMIEENPSEYYKDAKAILKDNIKDIPFYLNEKGIVFVINPDIIAPYGNGCIEYVYPFSGNEDKFKIFNKK